MSQTRSRDLLASHTQRGVSPFVRVRDGGDHVVFDTPSYRGTFYGHRLELDQAPTQIAPWFEAWGAAHEGKDVGRAYVSWETTSPEVPLPADVGHVDRFVVLVQRGLGPLAEAVLPVEVVDEDRWPLLVAAALALEWRAEMSHYVAWYHQGLWALGEQRTTWAAWHEGVPVAAVTLVRGEGWARFQDVWTAPPWRKKGLCRALICEAVAAFRAEDEVSPMVLVAEEGGAAERLYRRLGFVAESWMFDAWRDVG